MSFMTMPDSQSKPEDFLKRLPPHIAQILSFLPDTGKAQSQLVEIITKWLDGYLPKLEPDVVQILKYNDVIDYFVKDKPSNPLIVQGAILRAPHQEGELITQVFLDKNNDLVDGNEGQLYGRRFVAKKLEAELEKAFDGKSLILVK